MASCGPAATTAAGLIRPDRPYRAVTFYLSNGVINRLQHAQDDLNKHLAGYLRATGRRRLLLPVALPGAAADLKCGASRPIFDR